MTFTELCDKIERTSHRKDLGSQIPLFVNDARVMLNWRLGLNMPQLAAGTDTNEILQGNWLLFFYPSMKALYEYIVEIDTAAYYDQLYQGQVSAYYTTRDGTEPLTITPEGPTP